MLSRIILHNVCRHATWKSFQGWECGGRGGGSIARVSAPSPVCFQRLYSSHICWDKLYTSFQWTIPRCAENIMILAKYNCFGKVRNLRNGLSTRANARNAVSHFYGKATIQTLFQSAGFSVDVIFPPKKSFSFACANVGRVCARARRGSRLDSSD